MEILLQIVLCLLIACGSYFPRSWFDWIFADAFFLLENKLQRGCDTKNLFLLLLLIVVIQTFCIVTGKTIQYFLIDGII